MELLLDPIGVRSLTTTNSRSDCAFLLQNLGLMYLLVTDSV